MKKNMFFFSLRKKLILLLLFAILCTTLPLIFLSFHTITEDARLDYHYRVSDFFQLISIIIENDKKSQELIKEFSIHDKITTIQSVSSISKPALQAFLQKDPQSPDILKLLKLLEEQIGAHFFLVQKKANTFVSHSGEKATLLHALLQEKLSEENTVEQALLTAYREQKSMNAVIAKHSSSSNKKRKPITREELIYVEPLESSEYMLVSLTKIENFYSLEESLEEQLYKNLQKSYEHLDVLDDGFMVVYDAQDANIEASAGNIPQDIKDYFKKTGTKHFSHEATNLDLGDFSVYISYPLEEKYYLVVGLSKNTINALTTNLQKEQLPIFIIVLLLGSLLGPLCARPALKALENLTRYAKKLPKHDFTKNFSSKQHLLPLKRHDEIGDLARSFSNMSNLLHKNVKKLISATASQSRLETELKSARALQEDFLPPPLPSCEQRPYSIHAHLLPAREIGGDLYDYRVLDDNTVFFCIGDVSGKGMSSALLMGMTIILAKAATHLKMSPSQSMAFINDQLCQSNQQKMFVTLFLGIYHIKERKLVFSLAGHPPPIIFGKEAAHRVAIEKPNLVAGLLSDITYDQHEVFLGQGENVLLYTDGISEAMSAQGEFYGEQRLIQLCDTVSNQGEDIVPHIIKTVQNFAQNTPQADDMTLLLLRL